MQRKDLEYAVSIHETSNREGDEPLTDTHEPVTRDTDEPLPDTRDTDEPLTNMTLMNH